MLKHPDAILGQARRSPQENFPMPVVVMAAVSDVLHKHGELSSFYEKSTVGLERRRRHSLRALLCIMAKAK